MGIAYERRGSGPPVLLLHPLGADHHVWDPVLDDLARHAEVIALDVPGFGASPPLAGTPTPARLAAAVAGFLDELGVQRPHVVGNSHGGWIALELALAGRARSVTAIAPAGLWTRPLAPKRGTARRFARALSPALPALLAGERGRNLALAASVAHPERVPAAAALHLIRSYAMAPGMQAANNAMRAATFTELGHVPVPVTLAWPEHDRLVSRPAVLPPNVRNVTLYGCGHIPMWDDPQQVAGLILQDAGAGRAGAAIRPRRRPVAPSGGA